MVGIKNIIKELKDAGSSGIELLGEMTGMQHKLVEWARKTLHPEFDQTLTKVAEEMDRRFTLSSPDGGIPSGCKAAELYQPSAPPLVEGIDPWFLLRCLLASNMWGVGVWVMCAFSTLDSRL